MKEMKMEIERRGNILYVAGAPINGADWRIMRKPGQGTYARIAPAIEGDDADDIEIVVEEYEAPEERERWDDMSDIDCAGLVYLTIKADMDIKFFADAEICNTLPWSSLRFPAKTAERFPDAIRIRYYRHPESGERRKTVEIPIND